MKVLLIDGTLLGNKTGAALELVRTYIEEQTDKLELEIVSFADYSHEILDGRPFEQYNEGFQQLIKKIENADGYVIASPIFQGSIPGVLKNVLDMVHPKAMRYKPVSMIGNGGTYQHHLVVESQLKPILDYFRCLVTPNYVYTMREHYNEQNEIISDDVHRRLKEMARVFIEYSSLSQSVREGQE